MFFFSVNLVFVKRKMTSVRGPFGSFLGRFALP
jgi:hypothetical protein